MDTIPQICADERPIHAIWIDDQMGWAVGRVSPGISSDPCTRIVPYLEPGEMGYVAWFAVYDGDDLIVRVPARQCQSVRYR